MGKSKKVILCNTTAQVMTTISWDRAICLLFSGKAVSIKDSDEVVRSPSIEIMVPEIIMLTNYVKSDYQKNNINHSEDHPLPKRLVHQRDDWTCAYCGKFGDTIDHIVPKCLGGGESWDNVITACKKCNNKKDNKLLSEIGWELLFEPVPLTREMTFKSEQEEVYAALSMNQK